MSLNWNIEKVRDYKKITPGPSSEGHVTEALIWATMAVGIGRITEANADEFYRRIAIYEEQRGAWMTKNGQPSPFTLEDIKRRIGLSTNVGTMNKTEFAAKLKRLNKTV